MTIEAYLPSGPRSFFSIALLIYGLVAMVRILVVESVDLGWDSSLMAA